MAENKPIEELTREEVLRLCFRAGNLEVVDRAWRARGYWMEQHPDDTVVIDAGSDLSRIEDGLKSLQECARGKKKRGCSAP